MTRRSWSRALWPLALLGGVLAVSATPPVAATPPQEGPVEADRTWHEVVVDSGSMWLARVEVNGHDMTLLVDTGASQNVISKRAAARAGIEGKFKMPAMGVGAEMVSIAQLDSLTVGSWKGSEQVCALMDLSGAAAAMGGLDGILGMPFLMKFKFVEFDFNRRVLRFAEYKAGETPPTNTVEEMLKGGGRPAAPKPEVTAADGSGAVLERAKGGLRVVSVAAGSLAEAGGLKPGDLIEEIDEEAAESAGQLDARLKEIRLGKVTVVGTRDGAPFKARVPAKLMRRKR